ncbi:MAG: hypothetical protein IKK98_05130 [Oscillospiraceae bacterium]|nr:hypothetical protein [Oscillospiraceae bacterium]
MLIICFILAFILAICRILLELYLACKRDGTSFAQAIMQFFLRLLLVFIAIGFFVHLIRLGR